MNYKNKTVMITGAVRNTGLEIAKAFAAAGARIIINGRKQEDTERISTMLKEEYSVETIEATMDISKPTEVNSFFDMLETRQINLDVLVNNAVIQATGYSFIETPYELLKNTFDVNTLGLFLCSQRAAAIMSNQDGGSIINIGSNTAVRPIKNRCAYIASKGAVDALTRAMAIDLAEHKIRVNSVIAGYIHSSRWEELDTETIDRRRRNVPTGTESYGKDIANAVMFLASEFAGNITGTSLTVDGGCSTQLIPADCDK